MKENYSSSTSAVAYSFIDPVSVALLPLTLTSALIFPSGLALV